MPRDLALLHPTEVGLAIRGVDDEQIAALAEAVDDQVVDDPAVLVRQERVLRLPRRDPVEVVREEALQEGGRLRPLDLDLAHVRDVEDAGVRADGLVLLDDALVLDGHLPAGERNHPSPERNVPVVQRRSQESLGHAVPILVTVRRDPPPQQTPKKAGT